MQCPQKLLLQIPCFGKHFRSFERVKPTLRLDVSALCDDYGKLIRNIRYSPVTTSQTHALPRISTRGYTQKAAVCHA